MKLLLAALAFAGALGFTGCASEGPTGEEMSERFGRGIRGEGQLTEGTDRSDDPYVKPRGGVGIRE